MAIPIWRAALRMVVPEATSAFRPSTVTATFSVDDASIDLVSPHAGFSPQHAEFITHTPTGHFLPSICIFKSSRKYRRAFATGPDAVEPSPQTDAAFMAWLKRCNISTCSGVPLPEQIILRIWNICFVPSRHGEHRPHDSSTKNPSRKRVMSITHESLSITMMPPVPMFADLPGTSTESIARSSMDGGRHPMAGPPIWTALHALSPRMPPPIP